MKVLLWDPNTKLYVRDEDQWTSERELARDFCQSAYAAAFALSKQLEQVEALLTFDRPEHDLTLPVHLSERRPTVHSEPDPSFAEQESN